MTAAARDAGVMAYVGIGSNIEPARHVRMALAELARLHGELVSSSVYRSRAEGFQGDDFLNLVVGFRTNESAQSVVAGLERLHDAAGRVRGPSSFASRTLDLDLLLYGDEVIPELKVPREDIARYGFVLGPLAEIAPELRHPVTGETMAELWARFDRERHPMQKLAELPPA